MKRQLLGAIAIALLVLNASAFADGRDGGHGGHGGYSNGGDDGHGDHGEHGGHGRHGDHDYHDYHDGHGYNYGGHGYNYGHYYGGHGYYHGGYARPGYYGYAPYYGYNHNHNNNNEAAYLVGGLVVGSLLTNAYIRSQQRPVYTTTVVQQPQVVPAQGRHLLRDLNGDCFERSTDAAGNELRTQLPASECNW